MKLWIPLDQFALNYKANEDANIPKVLESIRRSIIDGTYNETQIKLTTIQAPHQMAVGVTSPCKKGDCECKDGKCGGRCGCIKARKACTSRCACN
jgi:hypothetical protein